MDEFILNTKDGQEQKSNKSSNGIKLKFPSIFSWKEKLLLVVAGVGFS